MGDQRQGRTARPEVIFAAGQHARLRQMQPADAVPDHGRRRLDLTPAALGVVVGELALEGGADVSTPAAGWATRSPIESSRSSITPGAPELSILTTQLGVVGGPVIWLR